LLHYSKKSSHFSQTMREKPKHDKHDKAVSALASYPVQQPSLLHTGQFNSHQQSGTFQLAQGLTENESVRSMFLEPTQQYSVRDRLNLPTISPFYKQP
jgi:hypothetical protein